MLHLKRRPPIALASLVLAISALAMTAGPASAWNTNSGGVKLSGTITIYDDGENPKTCTFPGPFQNGTVEGEEFFQASSLATWNNQLPLSCTGNTQLLWKPAGVAWYEEGTGEYLAQLYGTYSQYEESPYGLWLENAWSPVETTWVNASGGTPSHITLTNDTIGIGASGYSEPITASGTIYFTTLSGGDLTIP